MLLLGTSCSGQASGDTDRCCCWTIGGKDAIVGSVVVGAAAAAGTTTTVGVVELIEVPVVKALDSHLRDSSEIGGFSQAAFVVVVETTSFRTSFSVVSMIPLVFSILLDCTISRIISSIFFVLFFYK